jgi:hypothetical protein
MSSRTMPNPSGLAPILTRFLASCLRCEGASPWASPLAHPDPRKTANGAVFSLADANRSARLERTRAQDDRWLARTLTREGGALGTRGEVQPDGMLAVRWH